MLAGVFPVIQKIDSFPQFLGGPAKQREWQPFAAGSRFGRTELVVRGSSLVVRDFTL